MNQGTGYYQFMKENRVRKSHATVPLSTIPLKFSVKFEEYLLKFSASHISFETSEALFSEVSRVPKGSQNVSGSGITLFRCLQCINIDIFTLKTRVYTFI